MATTYDDFDDLDAQNEQALKVIRTQRSQKRVLVLAALGGVLLALLAMTYGMFTGGSNAEPTQNPPSAAQ